MVRIRVKLRPSSVNGKAGTIYYQISHCRQVKHITTNIRMFPGDWDDAMQRIAPEGDRNAQIRIDSDMERLRRIHETLEAKCREAGTAVTVEQIVSMFRESARQFSVVSFLNEQIQFLVKCHRYGTATNYQRAADSLKTFLAGRDLFFSEMTSSLIERYCDYLLRRGVARNSLSFYMRILRAVYNKAVRMDFAEQTFPFRNVYTGIERTRKRAVSGDVIARLVQMELAAHAPCSFARDIFLFSLYTRGMAFVDVAYLKKTDIQDGFIRYARRKTGQLLTVRIEPCIREIIDRYAEATQTTPYVFPILKGEEQEACYSQYQTALRHYNRCLHQLSRQLGISHNLSSYTSRHSWATIARNHNVPVSIISAGMGHSSERTTQIYLASLENAVIDNANRGILEVIKKSISR